MLQPVGNSVGVAVFPTPILLFGIAVEHGWCEGEGDSAK